MLAPFFNLLPVLQMDGARYLVTIVEYKTARWL
jgi:Zn-dependent protease